MKSSPNSDPALPWVPPALPWVPEQNVDLWKKKWKIRLKKKEIWEELSSFPFSFSFSLFLIFLALVPRVTPHVIKERFAIVCFRRILINENLKKYIISFHQHQYYYFILHYINLKPGSHIYHPGGACNRWEYYFDDISIRRRWTKRVSYCQSSSPIVAWQVWLAW